MFTDRDNSSNDSCQHIDSWADHVSVVGRQVLEELALRLAREGKYAIALDLGGALAGECSVKDVTRRILADSTIKLDETVQEILVALARERGGFGDARK